MRINISNTGNLEIYKDGYLELAFSGDTLVTAQTTIDEVKIRSMKGGVLSSQSQLYSAVMVADEDTRPIQMADIRPSGVGTNSDMTGAYTDVDELGQPDNVFLQSTVADQTSTFAASAISTDLDAGFETIAVGVSGLGLRGVTGPASAQTAIYSGTTNAVGTSTALDLTQTGFQDVYATDPDTATAWTFAGADAVEIGVKSLT